MKVYKYRAFQNVFQIFLVLSKIKNSSSDGDKNNDSIDLREGEKFALSSIKSNQ